MDAASSPARSRGRRSLGGGVIAGPSGFVLSGLIAAGIALTACTGGGSPVAQPPIGAASAAFRLVSYDSCPDALTKLREAAAEHVTAYGLSGAVVPAAGTGAELAVGAAAPNMDAAAAPQQRQAYSGTNTHEAGVDEPDLVKTDGRRIVTLTDGTLRVVDTATKTVTGTLTIPDRPTRRWYADQMLLSGGRVLLIGPSYLDSPDLPATSGQPRSARPDIAIYPPLLQGSRLVLVDLSDGPRVVDELTVDGGFIDARQVGSLARVVTRSLPHLKWVYPDGRLTAAEALRENRRILAESTIDDWLPRAVRGGSGPAQPLVQCADVSHPRTYSATSMLTVLTADLTRSLQITDAVTVLADGQTVYGTGSSLYIADDHRGDAIPLAVEGDTTIGDLPKAQTEVHKFDISKPGKPRYVGSGAVAGWLLNQYSMSEYDDNLRIATTEDIQRNGPQPREPEVPQPDAPGTESTVTVLAQRDDRLVAVGQVSGLGRGEQIHSVRFIGPVGYVVTFRQTDPLYTLDLRDPTRPRVVGELKITGFSSYLHPVGDGRLIGLGQDADVSGRVQGSQISLFDVTNPAEPRRLDAFALPGGYSEAESDPHAFLYWPDDGIVVVPMWAPVRQDLPNRPGFGGALVLRLAGDTLNELGFVAHPVSTRGSDPSIRRSLVIGDMLWTVSAAGAMSSDVHTLTEQAWVPFA
jgi:hypothetical protein